MEGVPYVEADVEAAKADSHEGVSGEAKTLYNSSNSSGPKHGAKIEYIKTRPAFIFVWVAGHVSVWRQREILGGNCLMRCPCQLFSISMLLPSCRQSCRWSCRWSRVGEEGVSAVEGCFEGLA
jgi:hypothetical protein